MDTPKSYWLATTRTKLFYGTDADAVAEAAQKHEWRELGHSLSNVTSGELSDFVVRDHRPIKRVYTKQERVDRGIPEKQ